MSVTVQCAKHPNYKAYKPPLGDCLTCQWIWKAVSYVGVRRPDFSENRKMAITPKRRIKNE